MKMPGMSNPRRYEIACLLTAKEFEGQEKSIKAWTDKFAKKLYDLYMPKDVLEITEKLKGKYLLETRTSHSVKYVDRYSVDNLKKEGPSKIQKSLLGYFGSYYEFDRELPAGLTSASFLDSCRYDGDFVVKFEFGENLPFPTSVHSLFSDFMCHSGTYVTCDANALINPKKVIKEGMITSSLMKELDQIIRACHDFITRRIAYWKKCQEMLSDFRNFKQLQEKWPEAFRIYQSQHPDEFNKQLPVKVIDNMEQHLKELDELTKVKAA